MMISFFICLFFMSISIGRNETKWTKHGRLSLHDVYLFFVAFIELYIYNWMICIIYTVTGSFKIDFRSFLVCCYCLREQCVLHMQFKLGHVDIFLNDSDNYLFIDVSQKTNIIAKRKIQSEKRDRLCQIEQTFSTFFLIRI